jgi:hypothetical protein
VLTRAWALKAAAMGRDGKQVDFSNMRMAQRVPAMAERR